MVAFVAQIDQAALTGESLPAKKFAGDVCFSGSTVKQGEKHAVVYATGMNTFFGRAAALIAVRSVPSSICDNASSLLRSDFEACYAVDH